MKKIISLILSVVLMTSLVTGCAAEEEAKVYTNEELSAVLVEVGGEAVTYNPPLALGSEELNGFVFNEAGLGFNAENYQAGAFSFSMIMTQAYALMLVQPAEGMQEAVVAELTEYKDYIVGQFEGYLPDQLAIAEGAQVEVLENGLVALVVMENPGDVITSMNTALEVEAE